MPHPEAESRVGVGGDRVQQGLAILEVIVERTVRDADGIGDLAQAQLFMTALCHQSKSGFEGRGFQIAVAIGGPARFCCHAPSYKATGQNATVRTRGGPSLTPTRGWPRDPCHIAG